MTLQSKKAALIGKGVTIVGLSNDEINALAIQHNIGSAIPIESIADVLFSKTFNKGTDKEFTKTICVGDIVRDAETKADVIATKAMNIERFVFALKGTTDSPECVSVFYINDGLHASVLNGNPYPLGFTIIDYKDGYKGYSHIVLQKSVDAASELEYGCDTTKVSVFYITKMKHLPINMVGKIVHVINIKNNKLGLEFYTRDNGTDGRYLHTLIMNADEQLIKGIPSNRFTERALEVMTQNSSEFLYLPIAVAAKGIAVEYEVAIKMLEIVSNVIENDTRKQISRDMLKKVTAYFAAIVTGSATASPDVITSVVAPRVQITVPVFDEL